MIAHGLAHRTKPRRAFISGTIRSDRAATDWPVGVLCWLLEFISEIPYLGDQSPFRLLGAGGVCGFKHRESPEGNPVLFENAFLPGDHGAALHRRYHGEIAKFLLSDAPGNPHVTTEYPLAQSMNHLVLNGILSGVISGACVIFGLFVLTAIIAGGAFWAVFAGMLVTLFVIRSLMAV